MESYSEYNHPALENIKVELCYLCMKKLSKPIDRDHIIPNTMYPKGAQHRPQLYVHKACNNGKKLEDERFKHRIQLVTQTSSPIANRAVGEFIDKIKTERQNEYLVGKKVRNVRLAKTLSKDMKLNFELVRGNQHLVQVDMGSKHGDEIKSYSERMARGLFMRNWPTVKPIKSEIYLIDKQVLTKKALTDIGEEMKRQVEEGTKDGQFFGQNWLNHAAYFGRKAAEHNAGMVLVEFYNVYWILAFFPPQ